MVAPPFILPNSPAPLITPTYDGSGQMVHPDILKFDISGVLPDGYRYIMAMTPYPYADDRYENPSILFSKDGFLWEPRGDSNPIEAAPGYFPASSRHNADSNLIYFDDEFYLYWLYRFVFMGFRIRSCMKLKKSRDGLSYSPIVQDFGKPPPSTEILYDSIDEKLKSILMPDYYSESMNGLDWSSLVPIDLPLPPGYTGTHHCAVERLSNGKYWMLFNDDSGRDRLWFSESDDCINWQGWYDLPVMSPKAGSWDSISLYKCSFIVERGKIRCWYSAYGAGSVWHLGYSETDSGLPDDVYSLNVIKEIP